MGIQERKERERERRRQQILVAAKRVFAAKGFNRATMEDVATEAELSPGTIYIYFKNKDELYASLSVRVLKYLFIRLQHVKNENGLDPEQRIAALEQALYDVYEFDPLILINMFHLQSSETLMNLSKELLDEIQSLSSRSINVMADMLAEGIKKGLLIRKDPVVLAGILWALFSGVILWEESKRLINSEKDYLKSTLEIAFQIFSRGIKKPAASGALGAGQRSPQSAIPA
jgi:AcrR family transcriptional regulator